ncbi:hypothetical protein D3C72_2116960 [compost metagenome]
MVEQRNQVRIVAVIIDDESGVDGNVTITRAREHGIGVTARPAFRLIEHDVGAAAEKPGGGQARNAGPDHCDPAPARYCRLAQAGIHGITLVFCSLRHSTDRGRYRINPRRKIRRR